MCAKIKARVVTFHYVLKNNNGELLDSSEGNDPLSYLEGTDAIIPGLENEIRKLTVGDKKHIVVSARDAYGEYDKALVIDMPKAQVPNGEAVKIGDQFSAGDTEENKRILRVTQTSDVNVTLDANHPLAGQDLCFDVEITEAREATDEELEHGHSHGDHGASH